MEATQMDLTELAQGWEALCLGIKKHQIINFGKFDPIFAQTCSLLALHASEGSLDKKYIPIISKAFLFANADARGLDSKGLAALVLTDRMLSCYAFGDTPAQDGRVSVYSMEARKAVCIDFSNISASIDVLAELMDSQQKISL